MNFQGRLTDASNNPLSGPHDFKFQIFGSPSGGSPIWSETQSAVPVANGVLAVQFGTGVPISSTVFVGADRWLEISVDGTPLSPRERLASVPFAFNAQAIEGHGYASFVLTEPVAQNIAGAKAFTGSVSLPAPTLFTGYPSDPAGSAGSLYFNSFTGKLRLHNGLGFVDVATGTAGGIGSVMADAAQFAGDGSPAAPLSLRSSSVTLQGNVFNAAGRLVQLDGSGRLPALDGSALVGIVAGQVAASGVQAGALGPGVIASSIAASAVQDGSIVSMRAGKLFGPLPALDGSALVGIVAGQVAASGVQAGALGPGVIAS
jgi:hypothetical protein